jgi:hypothetical protein
VGSAMAWALAFWMGGRGLSLGFRWDVVSGLLRSSAREQAGARKAERLFQDLRSALEGGCAPSSKDWQGLEELPAPWSPWASSVLGLLRKEGSAVLPTLERFGLLAERHAEAISVAGAQSAQPLAQAGIMLCLTPLLGVLLHALLPGVSEQSSAWSLGVVLASLYSAAGAVWLLSSVERARWGGLPEGHRHAVLLAFAVGEGVLARVRSGTAVDVAWSDALVFLEQSEPALASQWGRSVWDGERDAEGEAWLGKGMGRELVLWGQSLRQSLSVSVWEGTPCGERIEAALRQLRSSTQAVTDRELQKLSIRALVPLFICSAPSVLGLLVWGLILTWEANL